MESGSTPRVIQVLVGHEIFEDGTLPPLHVDDVISVKLSLCSSPAPSTPGTATHRVTVQPQVGHAPWADRDGTLKWPFEVTGDRWSATWHHHSPVAGLMHVTGFLTPDFHHAVPGEPGAVTGRVRRLQLVEQHDEWQVSRRYLSETSMAQLRRVIAAKQHALDTGGDYDQQRLVDHCA